MVSSWFLIMSFKCLHHVAWPLLALVYPMCASVQAIETDSYEETKHLISYWILLSLIYLFDYAFMNLLPWFQLWMYIKLMFIFWLTIPDFGRAFYVYNNLIHSMKLKIDTWRKCFVEEDNFLMHAERYVKENGTEALEKLIASKNTLCRPDAEATNEIIDTDNKEMAKKNGENLQTEDKDIKDLEAIDKIEIPATKQDIPVMSNTEQSQIASSAKVETKGTAEIDTCGGEVPRSSTQKEVQKEWTCALCLLTVTCEKDLNSHLNGKKHRAALVKEKDAEVTNKIVATDNKEILKLRGRMVYQKVGAHSTWAKKNAICRLDAAVTNEIIATDNKEMLTKNGERLQIQHKDIKILEAIDIYIGKMCIPVMPIIGASPNASSATVETKGTVESDTVGGEVPRSSTSTQKEVQKEWTCALCLLTVACEKDLNSHLNGRKHRVACEAALKAKKQPAPQKLQLYQPKVEVKQKDSSNMLNSNVKNGDGIVNKGLKGTILMDHKVQKPQNFNFHIIRATPSAQAIRGPTPFGRPMSSPTGVPFPYHSGATPFGGPMQSPISIPFPYYGPEGSWSSQPEFPYFIPTPRLPYQDPNRR